MRTLVAALALSLSLQDKPQEKPAEKPQEKPRIDQARIDLAVERGTAYLLAAARGDNINVVGNLPSGMDHAELVLYTLIHGGADPTDAGFQKLLEKAAKAPLERTYRVALAAMALEAFDRSKYQSRIQDCAQFLADNQCKNGQWSYGEPTKLPDRPKDVASGGGKTETGNKQATVGSTVTVKQQRRGADSGDNSNSQYAALGLRACAKAGVSVEAKVLQDALAWWEKCQRDDKGWGYASNGQISGDPSYGSMTAGAVGSIVIFKQLLKQDFKKHEKALQGLDWMGKNFAVDGNPKLTESYRWQYYWLYAVERAGDLYGTDAMGAHDWYGEGAEYLLAQQLRDGSWAGREKLVISDTCFAIILLRRATKLPPKVASGVKKP
jgi:hypothetical protein